MKHRYVSWHSNLLQAWMRGVPVLAMLLFGAARPGAQRSNPNTDPVSTQNINIRVDLDQMGGAFQPVWNYFGYDEPNYTYADNGRKLLGKLSDLSPGPVYVRMHNLFTTGDGSASLKWGSTNVYTENSSGKAVYSWTIVDQIFDTLRAARVKPLVELGFMPQALSTRPEPYRHNFPDGNIFTGWAYPPKSYEAWGELVFQFVRHLRERYGEPEVKTWLWEVWNEPDIDYWKGTPEEFFKLYDYSAEAVLRALPEARVGGPDTTGPASPKAAEFLRKFLEHCARGNNFRTGRTGARLDFISFHPKGSPKWQGDHVQMGIARQLASIQEGFKTVASYPEWRQTPIILGESDPEGCAACSAKNNPQNAYRNGPLYAAYEAEALHDTLALARQQQVNLLGVVTWAFEFEGQPYFEGFRELATNGIDKPVLNAFRMFGLLGGERLRVASSGAVRIEDIVAAGVHEHSDINAMATRSKHGVEVLAWNYHDEDLVVPDTPVEVTITGISAKKGMVEQFRIDATHSNAFGVWKEMGSPQQPSAQERKKLEEAGQLQLADSPVWMAIEDGTAKMRLHLPREAVLLVRVQW